MYEAHSRRRAAERCTRLKEAMISGVWANSNFDAQKKGEAPPRDKILEEIDASFNRAIEEIWEGPETGEFRERVGDDDPFFAAMKLPEIDPGETAGEIAARKQREDEDPIDWDQA